MQLRRFFVRELTSASTISELLPDLPDPILPWVRPELVPEVFAPAKGPDTIWCAFPGIVRVSFDPQEDSMLLAIHPLRILSNRDKNSSKIELRLQASSNRTMFSLQKRKQQRDEFPAIGFDYRIPEYWQNRMWGEQYPEASLKSL